MVSTTNHQAELQAAHLELLFLRQRKGKTLFLTVYLQVITPEEIVDPNVDEHSVMTYLSQFPKAKLKPGAPLRPKLNPKKARAYGPGMQNVFYSDRNKNF